MDILAIISGLFTDVMSTFAKAAATVIVTAVIENKYGIIGKIVKM